MRILGWAACLAVVAFVLAHASVARAEPSAAEKERARDLMEEGRTRVDQRDLKGALDSFKSADAIMHVPTTGFMVASTQAELGLLVEARETLARVLATPALPSDPEPFKKARKNAAELDEKLAARIPAVKPEVRDATEPVAVAPPRARGRERERGPGDEPSRPAAGGKAPDAARPMIYAGFGVAAAGAVLGTVTGLLMFSKRGDLEDGCVDKQCPPALHDTLASAHTWATVSTISFVVAGVGAAVGVYGLIKSRSSRPPSAAGHLEPWLLRGSF